MPNPFRNRPAPAPQLLAPTPERVGLPAPAAPPPEPHDDHLKAAYRAIAVVTGDPKEVVRRVQEELGLTASAARDLVAVARSRIGSLIADENAADVMMYQSLHQVLQMRNTFAQVAMSKPPEMTVEILGPDPQDPLQGAQLRPLTRAEVVAEMKMRTDAAKTSIAATDTLRGIIGKKVGTWADKPTAGLQVNIGLAPEDEDLLERLRIRAGVVR